jgi:hypothetical protein
VDVIDELEVNCVVGGRCRKRRVEVALAGAVAAIRRKKKSASSFLPTKAVWRTGPVTGPDKVG